MRKKKHQNNDKMLNGMDFAHIQSDIEKLKLSKKIAKLQKGKQFFMSFVDSDNDDELLENKNNKNLTKNVNKFDKSDIHTSKYRLMSQLGMVT
jgi:hypothetical protein